MRTEKLSVTSEYIAHVSLYEFLLFYTFSYIKCVCKWKFLVLFTTTLYSEHHVRLLYHVSLVTTVEMPYQRTHLISSSNISLLSRQGWWVISPSVPEGILPQRALISCASTFSRKLFCFLFVCIKCFELILTIKLFATKSVTCLLIQFVFFSSC